MSTGHSYIKDTETGGGGGGGGEFAILISTVISSCSHLLDNMEVYIKATFIFWKL